MGLRTRDEDAIKVHCAGWSRLVIIGSQQQSEETKFIEYYLLYDNRKLNEMKLLKIKLRLVNYLMSVPSYWYTS